MKQKIDTLRTANILMRMTEKSYRMGCIDANKLFNAELIQETFDQKDYMDLLMVRENEITEVTHRIFTTEFVLQGLRAKIWGIDTIAQNFGCKNRLAAIHYLFNWFYQKGLRDGSSVDVLPTLDEWDENPSCTKAIRIYENPPKKERIRELVLICQNLFEKNLIGAKKLMLIFENKITSDESRKALRLLHKYTEEEDETGRP